MRNQMSRTKGEGSLRPGRDEAAGPTRAPGKLPARPPVWAEAAEPWRQGALPLQRGLKVNQPGDAYEQEAERAAEQVMRMPAGTSPDEGAARQTCACGRPMSPGGMCDECKREQQNLQRQEKADADVGARDLGAEVAPPSVHAALQQPGQPLDGATRHFMESRFGHDFGRVRVHTGGAAASSAEAVGARAYTVGRDLVFNQGEYSPESVAGRRLLAHELAHTLQQEGASAQAVRPLLLRKKGKEDSPKATKDNLKAQQSFWDDLNAFFPNAGRKLAGTGYNPAVARLDTSFVEGLIAGVYFVPPIVIVGKDYAAEKDADKRKAWLEAELAKIDKWRVLTGRVDDQDVGDAAVTKQIDALDLKGKLDVLRKMEARKDVVANTKMQEFVRNRIHSTPLLAGAVTKDDGSFEVQFENVKIVVKPDVLNSAQVSTGAETSIQPVGSPNFGYPGYTLNRENKVATISFTPTVPQVTYEVQTRYAPGVNPNDTSGYGVGTRPEDTGEQQQLRFHEGSHGTVFIREVQANIGAHKYPTWKGRIGQTRKTIDDHLAKYRAGIAAFQAMLAKAIETSTQEVDCAGSKTIVQYHQEHKTTTTVKCQP